MREISLDTETTGLDPNAGHRMVEIGCVEMVDQIRTGAAFHTYLNPERSMPEEAERIHGLSADFLKDKPLFKNKAKEFLDFIGDAKLVIHNAAFDMKFINYEIKALGYAEISMRNTIDTVQIARQKFPGQPANLDALCRRFNIDLSARTKHGALLDAELLSDVYLELMGGRQASMSLGGNQSTQQDADQRVINTTTPQIRKEIKARHFPASAEEKEAHAVFIEAIPDALWKKATS